MAACMPVIVVSRSVATWEIDTFITVLSSTITNCDDGENDDHEPVLHGLTIAPTRANRGSATRKG